MEATHPKLYFYKCKLADGRIGYKLDVWNCESEYNVPAPPPFLEEKDMEAYADKLAEAGVILVLESYRNDAGELTEPDEELLEREEEEDY